LPVPATPDPWTTFTLPLRQSGPLPGAPLDLLRFLSSSITFMSSLSNVELYLDGTRLGRIYKEVGNPTIVGVPPSLISGQQSHGRGDNSGSLMGNAGAMIGGWGDWGMRTPTSTSRKEKEKDAKWSWLTPRKYMTLYNVTSTPVHIRAEVIKWVYLAGSDKTKPVKRKSTLTPAVDGAPATQSNSFLASLISSFASPRSATPSRPSPFASGRGTPAPSALIHAPERVDLKKLSIDQRKSVESSVLLSVFTAEARVKLDEKMETELERATKKKAPFSVKVGLIYVSATFVSRLDAVSYHFL
jgi:hypothetical protein